MKVLVTGANGLLATHTIDELLKKGYMVKGLLRNRRKFLLDEHPQLELVEGDLSDTMAIDRATAGCDYVIHIAAATSHNWPSYDSYYAVNVKGTENVVQAALKHKIKRLVYVCTANTIGHGTAQAPGHEGLAMKAPFSESYYVKSKAEGQKVVLNAADNMEVVIAHPTFMLGAYDGEPSSGKIIFAGYRKKVILCPPGGKNFVYVKDVAQGLIALLHKGQHTASYLLCNENLTYKEFFKKLAEHTHSKPILLTIPRFILHALGLIGNLIRSLGIETGLSLPNMQILGTRACYSNAKAKNELGIRFHSIDTAIEEAVAWFKERDML